MRVSSFNPCVSIFMIFVLLLLTCNLILGSEIVYTDNLIHVQLVAAQSNLTSGDAFKMYVSNQSGLSINYPNHWHIQEQFENNSSSILFSSPQENPSDRYSESLFIILSDVSDVVSAKNIPSDQISYVLQNSSDVFIEELKKEKRNLELLDSESFFIGNVPAERILFRIFEPAINSTITGTSIFTLQSSKIYTLTFLAENGKYNIYLPMIQRMLDSLGPIDVPNNATDFSS